jgi:CheY-like chemotaxis protein
VIEVRDTGAGIPDEIRGRLFDPFFTTKPVGEGTGLGLAICHGIVTTYGGELTVDSAPGRGTTFRVALPPAVAPPVVDVAPVSSTQTAGARARILVVDDDAGVGEAVRESLAREHTVVAVTSAADALDLLARGERYELILCDLMMPSMTGMDLHELLHTMVPAQAERMTFMTGGAFTPRARSFLASHPNARLEKPFDPSTLRSFVRGVV